MESRYERNIPAVNAEEQDILKHKKVFVAGCGGLGGYVLEYLARMGVGELTFADGDVFEASNLNRQILSSPDMLGSSKAQAAAERIRKINPDVKIKTFDVFLNAENADAMVSGQDLVIDALDNVAARLLLEDTCAKHQVTLVHGAIQGWALQAAVIRPGEGILHRLYGNDGASASKTSLPFTPAACAAMEAAEAVKLLCGRPSSLDGKLLMADLRTMEWTLVPLH